MRFIFLLCSVLEEDYGAGDKTSKSQRLEPSSSVEGLFDIDIFV